MAKKSKLNSRPEAFRRLWNWGRDKLNALLSVPIIRRSMLNMVHWGTGLWFPLRLLLGTLCVIGGIFGFLPILGFWLIPVGLVLFAWDVPRYRRRIRAWMRRTRHDLKKADKDQTTSTKK